MTGRAARVSPIVFIVAMALVFWLIPAGQGHPLDSFSIYSAMQTLAAFGLVALAFGLTMVAGEFDLSLVATYGLSGMVAVKLGAHHAWLGVLAAVGIAAVAGAVQGAIVARLGIGSMSVTLGGYLILLGLANAIGHSRSVPYANSTIGVRLDQPIAQILSWRSIVALAAFVVVGALMRWTRLGRDLRAVGGDRRASRTAGVPVTAVVVGVFVVAGALAAVGGALQAYSLATAEPDPGLDPLIFGATAALVGGVALTGGHGTAAGILAGAIGLSLLQTTFGLVASPGWVASLVTGGLLALAAVFAAPGLRTWWRELRPAALRGDGAG